MTQLRELEQPLRAWRAFRDIAHATRSLSAAQSLHWSHIVRHAEHHASLCREMTEGLPTPKPTLRGRIVVAIGSDLGLCGSLNREVSKRAAELHDDETKLAIVIGARLAALDPLPGALVLATPSSFEAVELLGAKLEDLCAALGDPFEFELVLVFAGAVEGDAHPKIELRLADQAPSETEHPPTLLGAPERIADQARNLARNAQIVAALARAVTSEHEARWRTTSRAFESANRRIAEQEQRLRKLSQEVITQEMLEARGGQAKHDA